MTEQHKKSPFENPDEKLWDVKIKDYKIPKRKKAPLEKKAIDSDIEGYIYVPKIRLYVAKEKSLHNLNWDYTHKELHKKGMQMLTIRQFLDFILYLKQNKSKIPEARKILDEILGERDLWRGEWLDAKFSEKEKSHKRSGIPTKARTHLGVPNWPAVKRGQLYISYNHIIVNGELVAKNKEPLEKCLMYHPTKRKKVDLASCNKQGLPTKEGYDMHYWLPQPGYVAGFEAQKIWAGLDCCWNNVPAYSIGVRAAFKKKRKNKASKTNKTAKEGIEPCTRR